MGGKWTDNTCHIHTHLTHFWADVAQEVEWVMYLSDRVWEWLNVTSAVQYFEWSVDWKSATEMQYSIYLW